MAQIIRFIDEIGKRIMESGLREFNRVYRKVRDKITSGKISRLEKNITDDYRKIGYYYINDKNDILIDDITSIIRESIDLKNEITYLRKQLNEIKKVNSCLYCGYEVKDKLKFCPCCGCKISSLKDKNTNNDEIDDSSVEIFTNKKLISNKDRTHSDHKINAAEAKKVTRLNEQINKMCSKLDSYCITIGRKYYDEVNIPCSMNINSIVNRISKNKEKIKNIKERSIRIKTFVICPECSEEISEYYEYCPNCGCNISFFTSEIFGSNIIKNKKYQRATTSAIAFAFLVLVCVFGNLFFGGRSYTKTIDMYLEACYTNDQEQFYDILSKDIISAAEKGFLYIPSMMPTYSYELDERFKEGWTYEYRITDEVSITKEELKKRTRAFSYNIKEKYYRIKEAKVSVSIIQNEEVVRTNSCDITLGKQGRDWYLLLWDYIAYYY